MLTHQQQPTSFACAQTCLAMALGVPVELVMKRFGDSAGLSQAQFMSALEACDFTWALLTPSRFMVTGWHFADVPSLNTEGGMHKVLIHYDADRGCSGFTVLDPNEGRAGVKAYAKDGSNLRTWVNVILFIPGGSLS